MQPARGREASLLQAPLYLHMPRNFYWGQLMSYSHFQADSPLTFES